MKRVESLLNSDTLWISRSGEPKFYLNQKNRHASKATLRLKPVYRPRTPWGRTLVNYQKCILLIFLPVFPKGNCSLLTGQLCLSEITGHRLWTNTNAKKIQNMTVAHHQQRFHGGQEISRVLAQMHLAMGLVGLWTQPVVISSVPECIIGVGVVSSWQNPPTGSLICEGKAIRVEKVK